jgi:hypothetical protein
MRHCANQRPLPADVKQGRTPPRHNPNAGNGPTTRPHQGRPPLHSPQPPQMQASTWACHCCRLAPRSAYMRHKLAIPRSAARVIDAGAGKGGSCMQLCSPADGSVGMGRARGAHLRGRQLQRERHRGGEQPQPPLGGRRRHGRLQERAPGQGSLVDSVSVCLVHSVVSVCPLDACRTHRPAGRARGPHAGPRRPRPDASAGFFSRFTRAIAPQPAPSGAAHRACGRGRMPYPSKVRD